MRRPPLGPRRRAAAARPNILLIITDEEHNWDRFLSVVPAERRAEFWDQIRARKWLKEHGVWFQNHYTPTVPCSPARSIVYTGHHAPDTQVVDNVDFGEIQARLGKYNPRHPAHSDSGIPTIGHVLREAGYYTAYQGKVHFADDEQFQGASTMEERYGFKDWMGTTTAPEDSGDPEAAEDMEASLGGFMLDGNIAGYARDWLVEKVGGGSVTQPWFLSVNFINPHDIMLVDIDGTGDVQRTQRFPDWTLTPIPRQPPYDLWWEPDPPANFRPDAAAGSSGVPSDDEWASVVSMVFSQVPFDATCVAHTSQGDLEKPMWQVYLNYYLNCMIDNDRHVWTVLDALLNTPSLEAARDNTVIIFTSDHGEMAMSHAALSGYANGQPASPADKFPPPVPADPPVWMPLRQKGPFVYEENNNVPLVVASHRPTALVPVHGRRARALTSHLDLLPTLLDWAGVGKEWYGEQFGTYLSRLSQPAREQLPGTSFRSVVAAPLRYDAQWSDRAGNGRRAVLFTSDATNSVHAAWNYYFLFPPRNARYDREGQVVVPFPWGVGKRGMIRGFYDGTVKFARYFSPYNYVEQFQDFDSYDAMHDPDGDYEGQDLLVLETAADGREVNNVAASSDVVALNETLRQLMRAELYCDPATGDPTRVPNTVATTLELNGDQSRLKTSARRPPERSAAASGLAGTFTR